LYGASLIHMIDTASSRVCHKGENISIAKSWQVIVYKYGWLTAWLSI
jgi:hypothetical protein